ncbi:Putative thioesterase [Ignavibacterium album JCM 16511]|uniref:Putative thioesterase n=1 Tax=Ignavibacterium album (strain DSM 19864 / JCM 16511 / NBRC 101810 / Mat9-16) TaxID=945713 RepID=I0ANR7_IGNAJ|nr:thioesterase family protein [Ignavibacterium album]AFH50624.1 Putative thioesterase [Ignavibacterium album JCM 16511]
MPRIKIDLPEKFIFKTDIPLRISDINYGGHLGNDSVLSIFQESRIRFLNQFGYSEINIEGSSIIMTDCAIQYKSQGYYGDILTVELTVEDIQKIGCDFYYRAANKIKGNIVAIGKTGIAFFDYNNNKLTTVPEKFVQLIERLKAE